MSGDETMQLARLTDPAAQREFFYALWTRKEAFIKALGKGFFQALDKTGMQELSPGVYRPKSAGHKDYRVIDLDIAEGYQAAVAVCTDVDSPSNAIGIKVFEE
jgi:phosphopantetheinyl transferase